MKKRMIAWMLVISILIPMVFVSSVYAAESDSYMVPSYGIYQSFMENSFPDAFNNRLYLSTLGACSDLNNLIDKASWIIGEDLSVERCTEILANMVTLMNYQLEDAIVEQASVDTTKTLLDYGMDLAGIAAGGVGSSSLKAGSDAVTKRITAAIGITNGVLDFTANTIEDLELLVQLEGDYSMQYDFLDTVYMYADIPEMKEAAQSLILANKEIMRYKIETITSAGESFAKFEATDVFLDQVAGELLEDSDFWDSDAYGPLMVLSAVYSKFSLFKLTLDIGLFLGDSLFGTSDIYNRYNEMLAMRDIHNALLSRVKANPALSEEDYENMDRNISLMKMALYVDARGEYCAYQMTTEGKLSGLFSSANEENIEKNYNTSIDIIENTFASLDGLYVEEKWDNNTLGNSALDAAKKQLSSVITYANGKELEEYHFTYNDLGQVISLVAYRYEDGNAIKWYTQEYEYDGNGNLVLVEHGSSQSYHYQYDYDADGQITGYSSIEYYEDTPGSSDTYIFSYDNQGRIVERRNEYGSSVEAFSYDESGKIVYESSDLYWGDGHFVEKTEYDYTYAPLVISTSTSESKEYGNSSSKSISFKPHWNLTVASGTIGDSCSFDVDSSGYLLRIIDANGNNVYVCNYQEPLTGNSEYAEWYKQVLQTHPEATKHSYTSGGEVREYQYDTAYVLYDIDKEGTPELIVQEDLSNYYVYTMSGSGATLCGKFYWSYSDCLYAYDGNGLVVHDGGIGSMRLEYLWLYTLVDGVLDSTDTIISTEEVSDDELYDCLKKYTAITNFIPITDYSLLENQ